MQQIVWNNAQQIAGTYPDSQKANYQAAAQTLRVPYWDWASHATLPDVVSQPMININTPVGSKSIVNPLYNYTFHILFKSDILIFEYLLSTIISLHLITSGSPL